MASKPGKFLTTKQKLERELAHANITRRSFSYRDSYANQQAEIAKLKLELYNKENKR